MAEFADEIQRLSKENHKLDIRLIQLEQYTRRESLVFTGIPSEVPQEHLEHTVLQILFHLGLRDLGPDDIVACHRLWSPPNSTGPAKVIVKVFNRKIVEWALAHQVNLKFVKAFMGLDLAMSPNLCAKNSETHDICKWLKENGKINNYYTRNGFAKVVINRGDNATKISHPDHLRKKFADANIPNVFPYS